MTEPNAQTPTIEFAVEFALFLPRPSLYVVDTNNRTVVYPTYEAALEGARNFGEDGVPVEVHTRFNFTPTPWEQADDGEVSP